MEQTLKEKERNRLIKIFEELDEPFPDEVYSNITQLSILTKFLQVGDSISFNILSNCEIGDEELKTHVKNKLKRMYRRTIVLLSDRVQDLEEEEQF